MALESSVDIDPAPASIDGSRKIVNDVHPCLSGNGGYMNGIEWITACGTESEHTRLEYIETGYCMFNRN